MNIIKGLLKKDLYNLSSYKFSLIVMIIFCGIVIMSSSSVTYAPIVVCTILGMISLSTFSYDDISKSNKYILTIPATKKEIVKEKYILAIGAAVIGGILGFIMTFVLANIMNYIRPDNLIEINFDGLISTTVGGIFGISLVQAIQIPSAYKWGSEKGRIQMFILIFIIIGLVSGIVFLLMKTNLNISLEMIENFMRRFGIILLIALIAIFYFISFKVSYKIYNNKDE